MRSHFMLGRGLAIACAAAGAATIPRAMLGAPTASDNASNAAYDDGWQVGENGGFGFGPWDMTLTYRTPVQHSLDTTSPYNNIGKAWTLFNPNGPLPVPFFDDHPNPPDDDTDLSQAGRRIIGDFQPGQTFTTIIDNPTEKRFFRGYTVRLNTGGGNTVYGGTPRTRIGVGTFEYFTYGRWYAGGTGGNPSLLNTDTDLGMRIDVTLDDPDNFTVMMTPIARPRKTYSKSGQLEAAPGSVIDWVEYEFYNTDSDFYNNFAGTTIEQLADGGQSATDFYIRGLEIAAAPVRTQWNHNGNGSWGDATKWNGNSVPQGAGTIANVLGVATAPRTITLDGNRTVRWINFDNANTQTIAPGSGGTLTIGGALDPGSLTVESGSHRITAKVIFADLSGVDLAENTSLSLEGGIQIGAGQTVYKASPGLLRISGPQTNQAGAKLVMLEGQVDLNSNAGAPATATTAASGNVAISIAEGASIIKLGASQNLAALKIAYDRPGNQGFDLASPASGFHSISIHSGDLDATKASLAAAVHNALGVPGDGIYDSALHANARIGVARLIDAHGDPFVYMRPTRVGDLNLDGSVTISDFIDLASNFNTSGGWQEGDLNGDGTVSISDFIDLASNFNTDYAGKVTPISAADQAALSAFAAANGVSLVPEPASLGLLLAGNFLVHRRCGRRKS